MGTPRMLGRNGGRTLALRRKLNAFTLRGAGYEMTAQTPCTVLQALTDAGAVGGLEEGLRAREAEWAAWRRWRFCAQADVDGWEDERAYLRFDRLQGAGAVFINGRKAGVFAQGPLSLDVTGEVYAVRTLDVEVAFEPDMPMGAPPRAAQGVMGDVTLVGVNALAIEALVVRADAQQLSTDVTVTPFVPGRYTFRYALTSGEEALGIYEIEENLPAARTTLLHTIRPEGASWPLWRPGRQGTTVTLRLQASRRGMACDGLRVQTGFRSIETQLLLPGQPAALCGVNGEPVFLHCARHAPDRHYARTRADYDALVRTAQEAHLSGLYVCGEEDGAFYDACDAQGLMVWQQLPAEGAQALAARLSHHPCVVQWAAVDLPAAQAALSGLGDGRPVTPPARTGVPGGAADAPVMQGPAFAPGMEELALRFAQDTAPLRIVNVRAYVGAERLAALAGDAPCWPETGPLWALRGGDAPALDRELLREACGETPAEDARTLCALSRFLQAETLRQAALCARMRGGGVVLGSLQERATVLCSDALIEADGAKRPAFFAVREALRPLTLAIRLDRTAFWPGTHMDGFIHLLCAEEMRDLTVRATLYAPDGKALWEEARVVAKRTQEVMRAYAPLPEAPGLLLLRAEAFDGLQWIARAEQVLCVGAPAPMWPLLHPAPAALRASDGRVRNEGAFIAVGVLTRTGYFCLLPGEDAPCEDGVFTCMNG